MGDLYRRFWAPVMLAEELGGPDSPPVRVNVLGEHLVAFRDSSGKLGLLDAYCPHRRANLYWGRNERGRSALRLSRLEVRRHRPVHGSAELSGRRDAQEQSPHDGVPGARTRRHHLGLHGAGRKDPAVSRSGSVQRAAVAPASDQSEAARQLRADCKKATSIRATSRSCTVPSTARACRARAQIRIRSSTRARAGSPWTPTTA